jgi:hypothetical protein
MCFVSLLELLFSFSNHHCAPATVRNSLRFVGSKKSLKLASYCWTYCICTAAYCTACCSTLEYSTYREYGGIHSYSRCFCSWSTYCTCSTIKKRSTVYVSTYHTIYVFVTRLPSVRRTNTFSDITARCSTLEYSTCREYGGIRSYSRCFCSWSNSTIKKRSIYNIMYHACQDSDVCIHTYCTVPIPYTLSPIIPHVAVDYSTSRVLDDVQVYREYGGIRSYDTQYSRCFCSWSTVARLKNVLSIYHACQDSDVCIHIPIPYVLSAIIPHVAVH